MVEKDLQAREKVEHSSEAEATRDVPLYVPAVDIYESEDAVSLVADMPGVAPESVVIDVRDDQLTIRGTVTMETSEERLLVQEYGVGDYYRQFSLGRTIDQSKIQATMKDGVLALKLPKADKSKPRKITVQAS